MGRVCTLNIRTHWYTLLSLFKVSGWSLHWDGGSKGQKTSFPRFYRELQSTTGMVIKALPSPWNVFTLVPLWQCRPSRVRYWLSLDSQAAWRCVTVQGHLLSTIPPRCCGIQGTEGLKPGAEGQGILKEGRGTLEGTPSQGSAEPGLFAFRAEQRPFC